VQLAWGWRERGGGQDLSAAVPLLVVTVPTGAGEEFLDLEMEARATLSRDRVAGHLFQRVYPGDSYLQAKTTQHGLGKE
jgi:hypothetical protein